MVVGLFGNESPDSNRFTLGNQNPTGLPVGAVSFQGFTPKNSFFGNKREKLCIFLGKLVVVVWERWAVMVYF